MFRGKSGKPHDVAIEDRRVARLVKQCQELPGSQLFQYRGDDGRVGDISSTDVNRYLRATMGQAFSAKDFRTWSGTVLAARALHEMAALPGQPSGDPAVLRAVETVARALGNTRTVCRRCYVHPAVIDAYLDGSLARTLEGRVSRRLRGRPRAAPARDRRARAAPATAAARCPDAARPDGPRRRNRAPYSLISVTSGSSSTQNFQRCSGLPWAATSSCTEVTHAGKSSPSAPVPCSASPIADGTTRWISMAT